MTNSKKDEFGDDGNYNNGSLNNNQNDVENTDVESSSDSPQEINRRRTGIVNGLSERLSNIMINEGDDDLLLQQSDQENNVLQWLQALDLQVIGACRADERLKPLLKLKVSNGAAEDRLLAHLSQHFEMPEVGMLARCLCIPLVSIRVGEVIKQGRHLCPTATRGRLNLILLPSSDLRISFVGDDGHTERLATLGFNSGSSAVEIEEIPADTSGLSFLVKFQGKVSYFWCSEMSIAFGFALLAKMKDLVSMKPSLAQLTGINKSRLDCFGNHLRAYVFGSAMSNIQANPAATSVSLSDIASNPLWDSNNKISSSVSKSSRSRQIGGQAAKQHSFCQGSLSPRSNPFKDGLPRNFSTVRSGSREKFRRRGDSHYSFSGIDSLLVASTSKAELSNTSQIPRNKHPEISGPRPIFPLSFLEPLGDGSSNLPLLSLPFPQVPPRTGSLFSPYYCWCPPYTSNLQYASAPSHLPVSLTETPSLPSLSSLLSTAKSSISSLVPPNPILNLADVTSLGIPALIPDPMLQVPFPVSSLITMSIPQKIPTFTPLICDPIVHIPVTSLCFSSGHGYLVSADPAISTTISPLDPNIMKQLIPETVSLVEKGARETLRLLLGSSQSKPHLIDVLPDVITSIHERHNKLAIGLVSSLPQRTIRDNITNKRNADDDKDDAEEENQSNGSGCLERSCGSGKGTENSIFLSNNDVKHKESDTC